MRNVVVVACEVLKPLFADLLGGLPAIYLKQGLHDVPARLREELQGKLDGIETPSIVLIGYGLCGNGLDGIESGRHWLVAPRADDCISLILGSYERYREEFEAEPATFYMSRGWIESGTEPLRKHREYVEKYGQETADWLTHETIKNYARVVFVAASQADIDQYGDYAREVADFCGVRGEIKMGSNTFIGRLISKAESLSPEDDLLIVPPGQVLRQSQFLR